MRSTSPTTSGSSASSRARHSYARWSPPGAIRVRTTLGDIAEPPDHTIGPDVPLEDAFRFLEEHDAERVPVVDGERRLIGVLSRSVLGRRLAEDEEPVEEDFESPDLPPAA